MQGPNPIDATSTSWTKEAVEALRRYTYAIIRLPEQEVLQVREMYAAAREAFGDRASRRQLRLPDGMIDDLDNRSGFVSDPHREWLELHCSTPAEYDGPIDSPAANHVLDCSARVASTCRDRCEQVLVELAGEDASSALAQLVAEEERSRPPSAGALETSVGFSESMLRVYQYARDFWLREGDGHHDMGLLTLIPKSTSPGLQILPEKSDSWRAKWRDIEQVCMWRRALRLGWA